MKKIIISLAIIAAVGAIVAGVTTAYFSDTETSSGNTFTAGSIDLKIDNKSYLNGEPNSSTTWTLRDVKDELFFNFGDLKPGDEGEDTISLHVFSNDAWACFNISITGTPENDCVEPEIESGDQTCDEEEGELQTQLEFVFWADDGDNVLETDENVFLGPLPLSELDGQFITLADATGNVLEESGPLIGSKDYFIGKAWCFGTLTPAPLAQDGSGLSGPDVRGSGVKCDGASGTNLSQTDGVVGNVSFYAVQSRNNPDFKCSDLML
jgi:predicted ribosomally synthesized peptide with SipW-like signal peptide